MLWARKQSQDQTLSSVKLQNLSYITWQKYETVDVQCCSSNTRLTARCWMTINEPVKVTLVGLNIKTNVVVNVSEELSQNVLFKWAARYSHICWIYTEHAAQLLPANPQTHFIQWRSLFICQRNKNTSALHWCFSSIWGETSATASDAAASPSRLGTIGLLITVVSC